VPLSRNLGTLTSRNPLGLSRAVTGLLYLYFYVHLLVLLPYLTAVMASFSVHFLFLAAVISICTTVMLLEMVQRIKDEEPLKIHFIYGFETKNMWLLQRNTSNDILVAYCHNQNTSKAHSTVRKAVSILLANAECGQPQPGRYFGRTGAKPTYNCLQSVHEDCYYTNSKKILYDDDFHSY